MPLFTISEARAFDKGQLASVSDYPDLAINAKELEIRQFLAQAMGADAIPTAHTETHDGDGSDYLVLRWPLVTEVTALSIDGVAVAAEFLNASDYADGMAIDYERGMITRRGGIFAAGWSNVDITYTAGYALPPELVKRAALMLAVNELPAQNAPWQAESFEAGGTSFSWTRGDGYRGNWSGIPDVQRAINLYTRRMPGVA